MANFSLIRMLSYCKFMSEEAKEELIPYLELMDKVAREENSCPFEELVQLLESVIMPFYDLYGGYCVIMGLLSISKPYYEFDSITRADTLRTLDRFAEKALNAIDEQQEEIEQLYKKLGEENDQTQS